MSDKKPGRPTTYSQEMVAKICDGLTAGHSMRKICAADDMPYPSTVYLWLITHKEFSDQYAKAREAQADALFDEVLDIADNASNEDVQTAKLRVDVRKWMAGKLRPKRYGEKVDHELSGEIGVRHVSINVSGYEPAAS